MRLHCVLLLGVTATPLLGQRAPVVATLPPPAVALDVEFTRIAAIRELADGRTLVTDEAEKKLFVVDWNARRTRQLGREGQGPGEYALPRQLFALAGDSTLLVDATAGRWLLLHRDTIIETVAADAPAIRAGARVPRGADTRVLAREAEMRGTQPRDPSAVPDWPAVLPPFRTGAIPAADGKIWIERTLHAGAEHLRYDVVDRTGTLVARVNLGLQERIVGFGRVTVYTVLTDDDGIQRLRRHPLPPIPRL